MIYKEHVEEQLEQCPDKRTNQNQILPLQEVSREIFYELKPKDVSINIYVHF
jgi:hypothetical protein